jgi:hypothetical protein
MADCHIGGWREKELKELGIKVFERAIDECISRNVGFILISGDLFNTALPSIDLIKETTRILKKAKDHDIDVYMIPGSHDFSPSGKTMIDVLEKAGLVRNVMKFDDNGNLIFTKDKTGVKITGIYGRKGGLEKIEYKRLQKESLENEGGFKIFMFHTAINEFKPADMEKLEGLSFASLPKKFNYYAGGHVHYIFDRKEGNSLITFPGALFPNNFKELEEFKHGGFYVVDDQLNFEHIPLNLKDVVSISLNVDGKSAMEVENEIRHNLTDIKDKIVTLRVEGTLSMGKPGDINFREIFEESNAYCILKNTAKLKTKEIEEVNLEVYGENIEEGIVNDYFKDDDDKKRAIILMNALDKEKHEGEKNLDFEIRLLKDLLKDMDLEEVWDANQEDKT